MIVADLALTPDRVRLLCEAHDDGQPRLAVRAGEHGAVGLLRRDGTELSETEQLEVRALCAAWAVRP